MFFVDVEDITPTIMERRRGRVSPEGETRDKVNERELRGDVVLLVGVAEAEGVWPLTGPAGADPRSRSQ